MAAVVNKEMCTGCEMCVEVCSVEAIKVENDVAVINEEECVDCGTCVDECPNEAISIRGEREKVEKVIKIRLSVIGDQVIR